MVTIHETHCDAPGAQISTESQSRVYGACTCGAALGVRARARGWPALWWFASSPLRLVGLRMRMTQKSTRPKGALAVHQWPSAQISHAPHRELVTHPKGVPQLVTHMWPAHRGACAHVCVAAAAGSPADIDGPHHGKRTRADTSTTESHMRCWVQTYSRVHSVSTCICSGSCTCQLVAEHFLCTPSDVSHARAAAARSGHAEGSRVPVASGWHANRQLPLAGATSSVASARPRHASLRHCRGASPGHKGAPLSSFGCTLPASIKSDSAYSYY